MNALSLFFAQPSWRHLVFALLHTLWQGAVLAILLAVVLRRVSVRRPRARYTLALAAQFGVLLAGLVTWGILEYEPARFRAVAAVPVAVRPDRKIRTPTHPASIPVVSAPATSLAPGWVPLVALGWLAGVVVMLAHTTGSALAAVRLTRGPGITDRDLLDLVDALRREFGIPDRIRVVACGTDFGPAVLGVVWPTLVLPVAYLTGLPPDELRAILAHELAHVRRHDYLWNLAQMLVESVLFFNPVVWWLGRQARIEREACCDAQAIAVTGRPLDYSRTLADWAERTRVPAAALAWGGQASPLRERIIRILRPGERPRARISWSGLLVLLLAGPIILFALHRGTVVAVKLAAQMLAPAERIERLKVAQAEYASPEEEPTGTGKVTFQGTFRTLDGLPLRKPVPATTINRSWTSTAMASVSPLKETFSFESSYMGSTYLSVQPDDYAPTYVGPFATKPGQTIEGITILLDPGFRAELKVVDERGQPVAGTTVRGGLVINGNSCYGGDGWVTDAAGIATIPHASPHPYRFSIDMPGFQPFSQDGIQLKPDAGPTLTLNHAQPTSGVVVSHDGQPIAGADQAVVRVHRFVKPGLRHLGTADRHHGRIRPVQARSARRREDLCLPDRDGQERPRCRDGRRTRPERPALDGRAGSRAGRHHQGRSRHAGDRSRPAPGPGKPVGPDPRPRERGPVPRDADLARTRRDRTRAAARFAPRACWRARHW